MLRKIQGFIINIVSGCTSLWAVPMKFLYYVIFVLISVLITLSLDFIDYMNGKLTITSEFRKRLLLEIDIAKNNQTLIKSLEGNYERNVQMETSFEMMSKLPLSRKHLEHEKGELSLKSFESDNANEITTKMSYGCQIRNRCSTNLHIMYENGPSSVTNSERFIEFQSQISNTEQPLHREPSSCSKGELLSTCNDNQVNNRLGDNVVCSVAEEYEDNRSYSSELSSSMSALVEEFGLRGSRMNRSIEDIERNLIKLNNRKSRLHKYRNKRKQKNSRSDEIQIDSNDVKEDKKMSSHASMISSGLEI